MSAAPAPEAPGRPFRVCLGAAAIVAAGIWTYAPALRGPFLWDDLAEVVANATLRSWRGLARIWFDPPGPDYLPLKSTVQWIGWRIWGPSATGFHCLTLALHLTGALLLWRILRRLGSPGAWLGGLVFAVHPVAVLSAAWISELKNTLSMVLLLGSIGAYLDFDAGGNCARASYLRSFVLFLACLLAKTSAVLAPVALLGLALCRRGRIVRRDLLAAGPLFACSAMLGGVTVWTQRHWAIAGEVIPAGEPVQRLCDAFKGFGFYWAKLAWPFPLAPIYPRWPATLPAAGLSCAWLGLALIAALAWRRRGTWGRFALWGMGCAGLGLLPILGLIPLSFERLAPVSDHFAYLALAAWAGLVSAGVGSVLEGRGDAMRAAVWCAAMGVVAALSIVSRTYAGSFADSRAFWELACERNPDSAQARFNLGNAWLALGSPDRAAIEYEAALQRDPELAPAHSNLGDAYVRLGRAGDAEAQYRAALRGEPGSVPVREKLGDLLLSKGDAREAIGLYRQAEALAPADPAPKANLAFALARRGELVESLQWYDRALALDPSNAENWDESGSVEAMLGRTEEAAVRYRRSIAADPHYASARNNLGMMLLSLGRVREAAALFEEALRIDPGFEKARRNLEHAREAIGEGVSP